jgi:tRNA (guanine-N7-)-methyltransferase
MSFTREEHEAYVAKRRESLKAFCAEHFADVKTFTLEIGCGHGHYLTAYAEAHPDELCIGIDLLNKRVIKGDAKKHRNALGNLGFLKAEATEFLAALPEHIQLDRVMLLYPDPWPKKKHHKNRLVQAPFLNLLAKRIPEGSFFYFRTDHEGYWEWAKEELEAHPQWVLDAEAEWHFDAPSFFEEVKGRGQPLIARRV